MSNLTLLLRRHSISRPQTLTLIRSLCSSSSPINPVSYPVKPKAQDQTQDQPQDQQPKLPSPPPPPRSERDQPQSYRTWTREDVRFVKDAPSISPVSYPSRVSPLPEDRVKEEEGDEDELRREARRIEADGRVRSYFGLQEEEKIPFPTLIKQEKLPPKVVVDLSTAIRGVKVGVQTSHLQMSTANAGSLVWERYDEEVASFADSSGGSLQRVCWSK